MSTVVLMPWYSALVVVVIQQPGCTWLFETPQTVACQAPLSVEFSRQEYWSELPFPSAADVPDRETEPIYPVSTGRFYLFIYFYHWATWVWALQLNAFLIWILVSFWVCRPHSWVCHHPEVEDSVCVCVCVCVCVTKNMVVLSTSGNAALCLWPESNWTGWDNAENTGCFCPGSSRLRV